MTQDALKHAAAQAALAYLPTYSIIGIGSGSTVNFFIDALAQVKHRITATVASSEATRQRLIGHGITVLDLNDVENLPLYVDGADEINPQMQMIKGGGGALTREKIIAAVAQQFICIADHSKQVNTLGQFPLPVEVIPMAYKHVARQMAQLGGHAQLREGFITDNGNLILDIHGLFITDPSALETAINQITGVVTNGLFALRKADILLLATQTGVHTLTAASQNT